MWSQYNLLFMGVQINPVLRFYKIVYNARLNPALKVFVDVVITNKNISKGFAVSIFYWFNKFNFFTEIQIWNWLFWFISEILFWFWADFSFKSNFNLFISLNQNNECVTFCYLNNFPYKYLLKIQMLFSISERSTLH